MKEQLRVVYETLHEAFRAKHSLVYKDEFINRYDDSLTSDMSESSSHLQTEFQVTTTTVNSIKSENYYIFEQHNM